MKIQDLPPYIYCRDCPFPHFLSVNRDIHGRWSSAYVEFQKGTLIKGLMMNNSESLEEMAIRMDYALQRWHKRGNHGGQLSNKR